MFTCAIFVSSFFGDLPTMFKSSLFGDLNELLSTFISSTSSVPLSSSSSFSSCFITDSDILLASDSLLSLLSLSDDDDDDADVDANSF